MAFTVILDGKPCSGKTTLAKGVEAYLTERGIRAVDAKSYAFDHMYIGEFLKKFREGEIETFRDIVHSGAYHLLSYAALELAAIKLSRSYDVVLMQRSPYSFSFVLDAVGGRDFEEKGLTYNIISSWAKFSRPDLFIYLTADSSILLERFRDREDGKDRIHRRMIESDDSGYISMLRRRLDSTRFYVIRNEGVLDNNIALISVLIRKEIALKAPGAAIRSNEALAPEAEVGPPGTSRS